MYISKEELLEFTTTLTNSLNNILFANIYDYLEKYPYIRERLNPAFPYPHKIRIGILKNSFVIEYCGPEDNSQESFKAEGIYKPTYSILDFLDIDLNHMYVLKSPVLSSFDNTSIFLGDSIEYLCDYFYDILQSPSELIMLNGMIDFDDYSQPYFVSNSTIFWTDKEGCLRIRRIDFMEVFSLSDKGVMYRNDEGLKEFAEFIMSYEVPKYKVILHKSLNEFIELINYDETTEVHITNFLENNPEILQYAFGLNELNPQILLEWQYKSEKNNLKPDFMPQRMDGYCDIFEFKMPRLKSKSIVGSIERQHPSFEIDSAIAQINCYDEWCSQRINTDWLEDKNGIKVLNPVKYLIMGHSSDFTAEERRYLRNTRNTSIFTYDEFIELVRYQIYRFK